VLGCTLRSVVVVANVIMVMVSCLSVSGSWHPRDHKLFLDFLSKQHLKLRPDFDSKVGKVKGTEATQQVVETFFLCLLTSALHSHCLPGHR
jgi:hypothetical protein